MQPRSSRQRFYYFDTTILQIAFLLIFTIQNIQDYDCLSCEAADLVAKYSSPSGANRYGAYKDIIMAFCVNVAFAFVASVAKMGTMVVAVCAP